MLIGAYGLFWERSLIDWNSRAWRPLGRRGLNTGALRIANFRRARGWLSPSRGRHLDDGELGGHRVRLPIGSFTPSPHSYGSSGCRT